MTIFYGIWVDHSRAILIRSDKGAHMTLKELHSSVEPHHDSEFENDTHHNERRSNQMKSFAKEIVAQLQDASEIVIFGPGTAKHDLKNELERHKALAGKLKGVETADKMTEHELKEFVQKTFHLPL